jgi:hypothetical protein
MADQRPLVVEDLGSGQGRVRQMENGEGEWWIVSPYCTVGGSANAIELTLQHGLGNPSAYRAGQQFRFRATTANTGSGTINVAGLGAKTAVTVTGAALPAGYIRSDVDTTIAYDAVSDRFVVGREVESGSNASGEYVRAADGTQVCTALYTQTVAITTPVGALFIGSGTAVDYAAEFASTPHVTARVWAAGTTSVISGNRPITTTAVRAGFQVIAAVSTTTAVSFDCTAHGIWY